MNDAPRKFFLAPDFLSPHQHELTTDGSECALDCPACRWADENIAVLPDTYDDSYHEDRRGTAIGMISLDWPVDAALLRYLISRKKADT